MARKKVDFFDSLQQTAEAAFARMRTQQSYDSSDSSDSSDICDNLDTQDNKAIKDIEVSTDNSDIQTITDITDNTDSSDSRDNLAIVDSSNISDICDSTDSNDVSNISDSGASLDISDNIHESSSVICDISAVSTESSSDISREFISATIHKNSADFIRDIEAPKQTESELRFICNKLADRPLRVLAFLASLDTNFINLSKAVILDKHRSDIPYITKRTAINTLCNIGAILHKEKYEQGSMRGLLFELNWNLVDVMFSMHPYLRPGTSQSDENYRRVYHSDYHSYRSDPLLRNSSSSFKQKETTTETPVVKTVHQDSISGTKKENLTSHPEYEFWRQQGLAQRQIDSWKAEFELTDELIDTYLRWAAWSLDAESKKGEAGKKIESPQNWFYHLLKRTGSYPKPADYVSFEERKLAEHKAVIAEKERVAKERAELLKREAALEADSMFEALLAAGPEDDTYKSLLTKMPAFLKSNPNSAAFRSMLRKHFNDLMGM